MNCNCHTAYDRNADINEKDLLMQICRVQFVCVELNLYLDTHPDDDAAMRDYKTYSTQLQGLIDLYEMYFGPLMNFGHSKTDAGSWVFSEWPWD